MLERYGIEISRKTLGRWDGAVCGVPRSVVSGDEEGAVAPRVTGTDDTSVKVLDRNFLLQDHSGRITEVVIKSAHHGSLTHS